MASSKWARRSSFDRKLAPGARPPLALNSPFAALHKSGSYRGFICRAFTVARPVSFDPMRT